MIRLDDRVWFLWALWLMLLPMKWLMAALCAACIHELFHLAAILLLGGKISHIVIRPMGTIMEVKQISGVQEAVCALAGPLGSLLLVLLIHRIPLIGLCALVQAVFNLLPIYPLDGGRAFLCFLEAWSPANAQRIGKIISLCSMIVLFFISIYIRVRFSLGPMPVIICAVLILRTVFRNKT